MLVLLAMKTSCADGSEYSLSSLTALIALLAAGSALESACTTLGSRRAISRNVASLATLVAGLWLSSLLTLPRKMAYEYS